MNDFLDKERIHVKLMNLLDETYHEVRDVVYLNTNGNDLDDNTKQAELKMKSLGLSNRKEALSKILNVLESEIIPKIKNELD